MADPDTDSDDLESMFDFLDGSDERRPYGRGARERTSSGAPDAVASERDARASVDREAGSTPRAADASQPAVPRPRIRTPVPVSESGLLRPPRPGEPLDLKPAYETDGRRVDPIGKAAPARRRKRPEAVVPDVAADGEDALPATERLSAPAQERNTERAREDATGRNVGTVPDNVTPFPQPGGPAAGSGASARIGSRDRPAIDRARRAPARASLSRTAMPDSAPDSASSTVEPQASPDHDADDTLALGVGDDFAFLASEDRAPLRDGVDAGGRLDADLLDGVHRHESSEGGGLSGWRTALGLGAAAVVLAAAAIGVQQLMSDTEGAPAASDLPVAERDVAIEAPAIEAPASGGPSLGDRFRARLTEVEALLSAGQIDDADALLTSLDRAVYGYGRTEFDAIQERIEVFGRTGELPPGPLRDTNAGDAAEAPAAEELAISSAEDERVAAERVAAERAEAERVAAERAEAERVAAERAEAERVAAERAEAERVAAERAEAERVAAERAEAERVAAERAEAERVAAERAEAERVAAERAATDRRLAEARIEAERSAAAAQAARDRAEAQARAAAERRATEAAAEAAAVRRAEERAEAQARIARERAAAEEQARIDRADAEARVQRERADNLARRRDLDREAAERAAAARAEAAAERLARADRTELGTSAGSASTSTPRGLAADDAERPLAIRPREIGDDELQAVYSRFAALESAIEARDINRVIGLTRPSARRIQQFLQLFENSRSLEARITGVSTSGVSGSITGFLRIESIERSDGVRVAPSAELASMTLTSERSGADWSAIDW